MLMRGVTRVPSRCLWYRRPGACKMEHQELVPRSTTCGHVISPIVCITGLSPSLWRGGGSAKGPGSGAARSPSRQAWFGRH